MVVDEASELPKEAPLGSIAFVKRLDTLVVRRTRSWNAVEVRKIDFGPGYRKRQILFKLFF